MQGSHRGMQVWRRVCVLFTSTSFNFSAPQNPSIGLSFVLTQMCGSDLRDLCFLELLRCRWNLFCFSFTLHKVADLIPWPTGQVQWAGWGGVSCSAHSTFILMLLCHASDPHLMRLAVAQFMKYLQTLKLQQDILKSNPSVHLLFILISHLSSSWAMVSCFVTLFRLIFHPRLSHAQRSAVKVLRRMQYFVARKKFQVIWKRNPERGKRSQRNGRWEGQILSGSSGLCMKRKRSVFMSKYWAPLETFEK